MISGGLGVQKMPTTIWPPLLCPARHHAVFPIHAAVRREGYSQNERRAGLILDERREQNGNRIR
ncbi:MAG: hypothetical protein ACI9VR_000143 [Cognaticolwellia sp.]|jgi:hypothetical protein